MLLAIYLINLNFLLQLHFTHRPSYLFIYIIYNFHQNSPLTPYWPPAESTAHAATFRPCIHTPINKPNNRHIAQNRPAQANVSRLSKLLPTSPVSQYKKSTFYPLANASKYDIILMKQLVQNRMNGFRQRQRDCKSTI